MKRIKLLLMAIALLSITSTLFGQAKKPTLMILPSDNWCQQRYFITEFDNQGTKQKVSNYKQAFQEDTEIGQVISKIGSLMIDRGFPLKDVEQELKAIEARNAELQNRTDTFLAAIRDGAQELKQALDIVPRFKAYLSIILPNIDSLQSALEDALYS